MASVRGIGVALIISRCGCRSALPRSASRCATPKRCCSSTIARPSRANSTDCSISACVPTSRSTSPAATAARTLRFSLSRTELASHATRAPTRCIHGPILRRCCSARISVGAISAACAPLPIACDAARAAITVLPLPTSPCSNLFIGRRPASSAPISPQTRCCAPVSLNGSAARSCPASSPAASARARCAARACRARCNDSCCASSSSKITRCQAGCVRVCSDSRSDPGGGSCSSRSAASGAISPSGPVQLAGTQSSQRAASTARRTAERSQACPTPAAAGYTGVSRSGSGSSGRTTRNCGCTISTPNRPPRGSPQARTRRPTASCARCDG